MDRVPVLFLAMLVLGCSRGRQPYLSAEAGDFQENAVSAVITAALVSEAEGGSSDTLYVADPLIVVDGRTRTGTSRLAGIGQGGQVVISSSQLEIRRTSSWGVVDYRWESATGVAREGRATFVLTQVEGGKWRIQHVHSSSPQ